MRKFLKYFFAGVGVVGCIVGLIVTIFFGILFWQGTIEEDIATYSNDRYKFRVYKRTGNWVTSFTRLRIDYVDKENFFDLNKSLIVSRFGDSAFVQFLTDDRVRIQLFSSRFVSLGKSEWWSWKEYEFDLHNMPETIELDMKLY